MGGSPTAMETYRKHQQQLPTQKVGYGVDGEMLAAPAQPKQSDALDKAKYVRDAKKPTLQSESDIEAGIGK